MTEVRMEPDAQHHLGLYTHHDEDLIDYESDIGNQNDNEDVDFNLVNPAPMQESVHAATEPSSTVTPQVPAVGTKADEESTPLQVTKQHGENELENGADTAPEVPNQDSNGEHEALHSEAPKEFDDNDIDFLATDEHDEAPIDVELDVGASEGNKPRVHHEIDYDNDEIEQANGTGPGYEEEPAQQDNASTVFEDVTSQYGVQEQDETSTYHQETVDETSQHPAEDEIMWDEEETHDTTEETDAEGTHVEPEAHASVGGEAPTEEAASYQGANEAVGEEYTDDVNTTENGQDQDDEIDYEQEAMPSYQQAEGADEEQMDDVNTAENGHDQDDEVDYEQHGSAAEELDDAGVSGVDQLDAQNTLHGSPNVDGGDVPAITIQYRGEEFPLFSVGSDGFFSELALLDSSMEGLMAAFRAELTNETPPEDELVFQVDELGLEFVELSLPDGLSGVNMRQIFEVFDLLVKNQDPDSSRVLYTYLFSRPNTNKRFESLVESATAGKGLDEVIYLFDSSMPHNATGLAGSTHPANTHDEHLDAYESPDDENNVDELQGDFDEEAEEAPGQPNGPGNEDQHAQGDDITQPDDQDQEAELDYEHGDGDYAQVVDRDAIEEGGQVVEDPGHALEDEAAGEAENYPSQPQTEDAEEHKTGDAELEIEEPATIQGHSEDGTANQGTTDTSTTNTIRDDGEAGADLASENAELDFNLDQVFNQDGSVDDDDELAEIDWREPVPEGNSPDEISGAVKRSRVDDELGMEDDKDVKRRRS